MKTVDWRELYNWGIVEKLNIDFLHSLGLRILMDENGNSPGCLVSNDLKFNTNLECIQKTEKDFNDFLKRRNYFLTHYLDIRDNQNNALKQNNVFQSRKVIKKIR